MTKSDVVGASRIRLMKRVVLYNIDGAQMSVALSMLADRETLYSIELSAKLQCLRILMPFVLLLEPTGVCLKMGKSRRVICVSFKVIMRGPCKGAPLSAQATRHSHTLDRTSFVLRRL